MLETNFVVTQSMDKLYVCLYYKVLRIKLHKIVGIQIKLVHEISSRLETVGTKLLWSWGTHKIVGVYLYVYS